MHWIDWVIVAVPLFVVLYLGLKSQRYVHGVAGFLAADRVAGRYVVAVASGEAAMGLISIIAMIERDYSSGIGFTFWDRTIIPLTLIFALTGYCTYRFRETKAMSLGQFLDMRDNRPFRIIAAFLRSISEMLGNMIMPAVGARFFIYFLGLPYYLTVPGFSLGGIAVPPLQIPTFMLLTLLILTIAIGIICMGGTLALVITDSIQGMFCYPLLVLFAVFVLCKFSWSQEIVPVMQDRIAGENFLNPYDIQNMRDFNIFHTFVMLFTLVINRDRKSVV